MIDITGVGNWKIERPHVVVVDLVRDARVLNVEPVHQRQHRVARHQVRDRPVDGHGDHEGHAVDEQFPREVAQHGDAS
jgi:hypothetical protein